LLNNPNTAEWAFQYMLPILQQTELSEADFCRIKAYCDRKGIRFMCTPWDEDSLEFLDELGQDAFKVSSADLVNFPLLEKIIATGKPLILSTGMATPYEIERTVGFLQERQAEFALLHCVSTYPAPFESLNLRFIETLKQYGIPVGYSSHERGIAMPLVALALGASIIEKHVTLDRTLPGPDHPASLEPGGLQKLVRDIRNAEAALGRNEKHLSAMEKLNRQVLRKSLVAARFLPEGTVITADMVAVKGPGKGLSPQRLPELIGARLARDVAAEDYFIEGDVQVATTEVMETAHLRRPWGLKARFHDLVEVLAKKPKLVELHFSEADVVHSFAPPAQPYSQQLFIHAPEFFDSRLLNLATEDDELREQSLALLQKTIDKAVALRPHFAGGIGGIVIHVGGMSMDEPQQNHRQLMRRAADAFRSLDSRGIPLLPENLPPRPWYLGGQWFQNIFIRPEEMIEFCQELDVSMTLDLSHAQLYCNGYGQELHDYVRLCLPYTHHLHIADASGIDGEGIQIGEGVIEWDIILPLLAQKEFTWVPEIWSGHLHNGAGFVEAVNRLGQYNIL
jgi:sialic acid synthase SpsE/sugar phosphate isomerase/epimerase